MKKIIVKGVQADELKKVKQIVDSLNLGKYNLKLSVRGVIGFEFINIDAGTWENIDELINNTDLVNYSVEIINE